MTSSLIYWIILGVIIGIPISIVCANIYLKCASLFANYLSRKPFFRNVFINKYGQYYQRTKEKNGYTDNKEYRNNGWANVYEYQNTTNYKRSNRETPQNNEGNQNILYDCLPVIFRLIDIVPHKKILNSLSFGFFMKPKKETTPYYYQNNDKPMHPLCISNINQETNGKGTEYPSNNIPKPLYSNPPASIMKNYNTTKLIRQQKPRRTIVNTAYNLSSLNKHGAKLTPAGDWKGCFHSKPGATFPARCQRGLFPHAVFLDAPR